MKSFESLKTDAIKEMIDFSANYDEMCRLLGSDQSYRGYNGIHKLKLDLESELESRTTQGENNV